MAYAAFLLDEGLPSADARRTALVQGTVVSIPERQDRGIRFEYLIDQTHPPSPPLNLRRVRLTWYNNPGPLRAGEVWQFRLRLRTPHGSLNPGSLDYEGWLFAEGIRAVGYVVTSTENRRLGAVSPLSMPGGKPCTTGCRQHWQTGLMPGSLRHWSWGWSPVSARLSGKPCA